MVLLAGPRKPMGRMGRLGSRGEEEPISVELKASTLVNTTRVSRDDLAVNVFVHCNAYGPVLGRAEADLENKSCTARRKVRDDVSSRHPPCRSREEEPH